MKYVRVCGLCVHVRVFVRVCVCVCAEQNGRRSAVAQLNLQQRNSLQYRMGGFDTQQCRCYLVWSKANFLTDILRGFRRVCSSKPRRFGSCVCFLGQANNLTERCMAQCSLVYRNRRFGENCWLRVHVTLLLRKVESSGTVSFTCQNARRHFHEECVHIQCPLTGTSPLMYEDGARG